MAEEVPLVRVSENLVSGGMPIWEVWSIRPDGGNHVHGFPKSTLEQRVAEYDLDPEDIDTVLDIVLHERFLPDETFSPSSNRNMPAAPTLFEAATPGEARKAHLTRIAEAKQRFQYVPHVREEMPVGFALRVVTEAAEDPLEIIRRDHGITRSGVAERREAVHRVRFEDKSRPRPTRGPGVDKAPARRMQEMVENPDNPEFTVAPGWVTLQLRQE